ncbi:MAG: squalene--hopene cyclase [Planctomycetaceae bacterium]|nr:squalene--hopene cyclase [Planctomycetaceae bacterium]
MDPDRLRAAYEQAKSELLAERTPDGHWVGELSSSALSTATAVSALAVVRRNLVEGRKSNVECPTFDLRHSTFDDLISRGVGYLVTQQNEDGGFGDTDLSHSNIATTYLVVAALHLAESVVGNALRGVPADLLPRANAYIDSKGGLAALRERYGIDKTFVVPIMTNLALASLVDWRQIDPLPFELACVPQSLYRFVGMPVVSYAIPALVAIGQARYFHAPPRNPITRLVRRLSISRSLKVLRRMQPESGGYLEATPLTSFVVMSLASIVPKPVEGRKSKVEGRPNEARDHSPTFDIRHSTFDRSAVAAEVIQGGVKFLAASIRPDGSWPIDTNLATWNTTLAINALAGAGEDVAELLGPQCLDWLLSCQHTKRHPFTGADPGGFGWSDLSGAVPDADDTPGALLAINAFSHSGKEVSDTLARAIPKARDGIRWLRRLQNSDGGWPTFCRGWGRLPFDRSGTDLTAHALRVFEDWSPEWIGKHLGVYCPDLALNRRQHCRALCYLAKTQHPDSSWSPLWFGNQDHPTEDNPVYGTAKVLMAYRDLGLMDSPEAQRGVAWLVANQNADGGWGSGVWHRVRNAECVVPSAEPGAATGVESTRDVTGPGGAGHLVLGTEYSVPSTQYLVPGKTPTMANINSGSPQGADAPRSPLTPHSALRTPHLLLLSSIEETALAVEGLLAACHPSPEPRAPSPVLAAVEKGLNWLVERVECGEHRQPAPIGFYFAKLWYYERLYPLTFTVAALGRACHQTSGRTTAHPASTGTTPWTTAAS